MKCHVDLLVDSFMFRRLQWLNTECWEQCIACTCNNLNWQFNNICTLYIQNITNQLMHGLIGSQRKRKNCPDHARNYNQLSFTKATGLELYIYRLLLKGVHVHQSKRFVRVCIYFPWKNSSDISKTYLKDSGEKITTHTTAEKK